MNFPRPRAFAASLICFSLLVAPVRAETLSTEKAPDVAAIPTSLPADQNNALQKQLAGLAALRSAFGVAQESYNNTPRTDIVVGSAQETELNLKIATVNLARANYISAVKMFNEAMTAEQAAIKTRRRFIEMMSDYVHRLDDWDKQKKPRRTASP